MKKIIKLTRIFKVLLVLLVFAINGCKKSSSIDNVQEPKSKNIEIYNSKKDPRFLRANLDNEEGYVEFSGSRKPSGLPNKVEMITVKRSIDSAENFLLLDDIGRVKKVYGSDGSYFELYYDEDENVAYTIILPDGSQLNSEDRIGARLMGGIYGGKGLAPREGKKISKRVPSTNTSTKEPGEIASTNILVTRCGFPANPDIVGLRVYKDIYNPSTNRSFIKAEHTGNGVYSVNIPAVGEDLIVSLNNLCTTGADMVDDLSSGKWSKVLFKAALLSVLQSSYSNTDPRFYNWAKHMLDIDEVLSIISDKFYLHKQAGCSVFSEAELYNFGGLDFKASVMLPPGYEKEEMLGETIHGSAKPPFPILTVDLGNKPIIQKLSLEPSHPAVKEGYIITAEVSCLSIGTPVSISVKGTDGYEDSISNVVNFLNNGIYTISLFVPGANTEGIQDKIILTAGSLSKEASIVFGK